MSMASFDYLRPATPHEAVLMLRDHPGAKLIAGGHSLLPAMKLRLASPPALIDLGQIADFRAIEADGNGWRIGALVTHSELVANEHLPGVIRDAAMHIGDTQVRNRGTVGGNVAHADPASDLPTVFMCLDATFHVMSPDGEKAIPVESFFTGLFETALADDELLTHVSWLSWGAGSGSAYTQMFNPASRYAMVGAGAQILSDGQTAMRVRVAVGGLTVKATRAPSVEAALTGRRLDADSIAAAAQAVLQDLPDDDELVGDMHASATYRKAMTPVYVKRALLNAAERCG